MTGLEAITFDFGNTLVPFPARPTVDVMRLTAARIAPQLGVAEEEFARVWAEERARQFEHEVSVGLEADMVRRAARVLVRLRGLPAPPVTEPWEGSDTYAVADPDEVETVLEAYADFFVWATPVPPGIEPMLGRLRGRFRLGIISNWPLAMALERFVEAAGWSRHLDAVVVSQRVGAIKPGAAIFMAAARELKVRPGPSILHVGDDVGADVAGAHGVGWRAALVRLKPDGSMLPTAAPAPHEKPDLIIDSVLDLEAALALHERPAVT
jgi:putative hydrolase of the HAD superfamily